MTHTNHTPTPLTTDPDLPHVITDESHNPVTIATCPSTATGRANAAHIVLCVNSHKALMEMLESIVIAAKLDRLPVRYPEWARLIDECGAALAAAKDGE